MATQANQQRDNPRSNAVITRGERKSANGFESAERGTIYWTLSLYIEPHKVVKALKYKDGDRIPPSVFRKAQMLHTPSFALRNAIDPLMNDIADRETHGEVHEFLLAATASDEKDLKKATAEIRKYETLVFQVPRSISWTTEGTRFQAHPPHLYDRRAVRLRRFWFAHNNGALSYHLSFSHFYGSYTDAKGIERSGYDPSTFYFLSLLQKLMAPKEYALDPGILKKLIDNVDPYIDVFSEKKLGIDPLDNIKVKSGRKPIGFWPFVREQFFRDAKSLFPRLTGALGNGYPAPDEGFENGLMELVPFIEVPGLKVPKSRFMFMLDDERLFDRLMPVHPVSGGILSRKQMVKDRCFEPYADKIVELSTTKKGAMRSAVNLGGPNGKIMGADGKPQDFWDWVINRDDYAVGLKFKFFARLNPSYEPKKPEGDDDPRWAYIAEGDMVDLEAAMHAGECYQLNDRKSGALLDKPILHDVPAFAPGRTDCLLYLFLAGFNQNIIDFMNQDTSEILDSIDPIYPKSDEQSDERFFVRYANHRAMITYVPQSRSLETGNDYIGTCPYAFLIHVLALHNEFLARGHEDMSHSRIERIEAMVYGTKIAPSYAQTLLEEREKLEDSADLYYRTEMAINRAKLAEFSDYARFRYNNPFRYDTERDVFAKLEELRGTNRKQAALSLAINSLEDHAADLRQKHNAALEKKEGFRLQLLNLLLGSTGFFGAGQMFYWIGEKALGEDGENGAPPRAINVLHYELQPSREVGELILATTEALMTLAVFVFFGLFAFILLRAIYNWWAPEPSKRP